MCADLLCTALQIIGMGIIVFGMILDIIGAAGLVKFRNYFLRLHPCTVCLIGGTIVPLIGVAILALGCPWVANREWMAFGILFVACFLWITVPTSTHALARAVLRGNVVEPTPCVCNHWKEDMKR